MTVFAGTTGEGNVLLRDSFAYATGKGDLLLRGCFAYTTGESNLVLVSVWYWYGQRVVARPFLRVPLVEAIYCCVIPLWKVLRVAGYCL